MKYTTAISSCTHNQNQFISMNTSCPCYWPRAVWMLAFSVGLSYLQEIKRQSLYAEQSFSAQRLSSIYCVCTATCQAVLGQKGCLLPAALESAWASIQPTQQPVQCCLALQTGMGGEVWGVASFIMLPPSLFLSISLFLLISSLYTCSHIHISLIFAACTAQWQRKTKAKKKCNCHLLKSATKIALRGKNEARSQQETKKNDLRMKIRSCLAI